VTADAGSFAVQPLTPADLDRLVALQISDLEGSRITELGPTFLTRMYRLVLGHPATVALLVRDGPDGIAGCAVATLDVAALNHHVKPRLLPALALALVPPGRWPLAWSLLHGLTEAGPRPPLPAELLLLVVAEPFRRRGLARALVAALEETFRRHDVARYRVAVRSGLENARAFYGALGFEPEQELPVFGQPMSYLVRRIDP
jgi:GNAT superfamily N-acetyltransferase